MADLERRNDPTFLARILDALVDAFAERVASALDRILVARAAERDDSWGTVSQKTLPNWIQSDSYVEACRSGAVVGARLWRRQWLAPRDAVLAWVEAESRAAEAAVGPSDPIEEILASNGYTSARKAR